MSDCWVRVGIPVDGEAEELLHQADAGTGGRREAARAVPARTDHHADGRDLVLSLNDGEVILLGLRIDAEFLAMRREGLGQRGRGCDRIPRAHRGAAEHRAETGRVVALDEDAVADLVVFHHLQLALLGEIGRSIVVAQPHRGVVQLDQLVLAGELLGDQAFDRLQMHRQQLCNRTQIDHILQQLALARNRAFQRV
jgi:hypothetical protein